MDPELQEILDLVNGLVEHLGSNAGNLSQETQQAISEFLLEINQFIEEFSEPQIEPPLPNGTELLWELAGRDESAFVNYLRTVPDPALNNLLRSPDALNSTISRLQQQYPIDELQRGEIAGIPEAPINSSNIYGFDYDPRSKKLAVRFQSGSIYTYDGVPPGIFMVFKQGAVPAKTNGQNQYGMWWQGKQPSLGAAFYEMIRNGGYPYQKVA